MSLASLMLRTLFSISDRKRDAGLTVPEDIVRSDNIVYGRDRKWNVLDVYRPLNAPEKLPVIVSVHGGGWVYGDKDLYQYYCMALAQMGFSVVNFTYRLAPKYKYPSSLEDTAAVFEWVYQHSEEYGFDKDHLFAVGDSAGAHMLAIYCCLGTNAAYRKMTGLNVNEAHVLKAVALNCGVYRMVRGEKKDMTSRLMTDFLPGKGTEEELLCISPVEHVTPAFPPSIVMTAEGDFLAEQALPMVEKLKSMNVPVEYRYYGDREHSLGHVFHLNIRSEDAQRCNLEECRFFKTFL